MMRLRNVRRWVGGLVIAAPMVVHAQGGAGADFRPPAVPLITSDPYLSIWSGADKLTDDVTRHWTHRPHSLLSLIRVDGKAYRLMGRSPSTVPPMPQVGLTVTPTRSIYRFANKQVQVELTFMTPALPDNLDVLSRPVTYLTWKVRSVDGAGHKVSVFDSTSSHVAIESTSEPVVWKREKFGPLTALKAGSLSQTILRPAGDDARINWGYVYAVASSKSKSAMGAESALSSAFAKTGKLPLADDKNQPRKASVNEPTLAFSFDLGTVGYKPVSTHMMVGYDEIYSIEYFGQRLRPYWRRNGATPADLFKTAEKEYSKLIGKCEQFDRALMVDAAKVGGTQYAKILALSYRECLAGNGIAADSQKKPLMFTKENTSNGDIATVDVIFPMAPIFVLLNPTLMKASLVSNFDYAASPRWKFPNAPHDLGTYPQVFGRDDGGEGMPVEESGNMIILVDAIAHAEGNTKFANAYWPQLTQWAKYLTKYGLDPENQLCTDDFMGHLAHNANLSVKAILALAAYGDLCKMRGDAKGAKKYLDLARADARHWQKVADAGDRSLLAFDKPNTWSQKYNLVWDKILGLNVFPAATAKREIAFYKTVMQPYGLPLDSRTKLTKTDWTFWCAAMTDKKADFEFFTAPIYKYLNETTTRDAIADSYVTNDVKSGGMHARPVVGGFFIQMLTDKAMWKKWARKDTLNINKWAPMPKAPVIKEIVPTALTKAIDWHYSLSRPSSDWVKPGFDDSSWSVGKAGFGTADTPGAKVGTEWKSSDIWIRRTLTLPNTDLSNLKLLVYHDEDVQVYVNGVLALSEAGYVTQYQPYDIAPAARKFLKPGAKITLCVHCHQTEGGQAVDAGFAKVFQPRGN